MTHVEAVRTALATKASGWLVEEHDDYDGDMILIITSRTQPEAPVYVLSGTQDGVHLALVRDDDCWETLSCVSSLPRAIDLLQQTIGIHALGRVPA
jgi:hypothetical protein